MLPEIKLTIYSDGHCIVDASKVDSFTDFNSGLNIRNIISKDKNMSYKENERQKVIKLREDIFHDPGNGLFYGKEREFVLQDPALNLWEGIREDAVDYFKRNNIQWWSGSKNEPTGHLLSSQVACINHLYLVRQRKDMATAILRAINQQIASAEIVDDGYVEFEFVGDKQYLAEKSFTRGANCTSVDAAMIGQTDEKKRILFLIEWKYTESYYKEDKYIPERAKVYDHLIQDIKSPFCNKKPDIYYFEPFYQLMRQTLLGWKLCEQRDHQCSEYRHVHVVPVANKELNVKVTSPGMNGCNVTEAWKSVLNQPELFVSNSPDQFLNPIISEKDSKSLISYLQKRYW